MSGSVDRRIHGDVDYVSPVVTADVSLTDQAVSVSLDGAETWLPAAFVGNETTWEDTAGVTWHQRGLRAIEPVTFDAGEEAVVSLQVLVRVEDTTTTRILPAGWITVLRPS